MANEALRFYRELATEELKGDLLGQVRECSPFNFAGTAMMRVLRERVAAGSSFIEIVEKVSTEEDTPFNAVMNPFLVMMDRLHPIFVCPDDAPEGEKAAIAALNRDSLYSK